MTNSACRRVAAVVALLLVSASWSAPGLAQALSVTERPLAPQELEELVRAAGPGGVRVLVIEREPASVSTDADGVGPSAVVEAAEQRLVSVGRAAAADLAAVSDRLQALWPGQGWTALAEATLLAVLACAAAWLLEAVLRRRMSVRTPERPHLADEAERHKKLLRSVGSALASIAFQIAVAVVIFVVLTERGGPERQVGYAVILVGFLTLRVGLALMDIFIQQAGALRLVSGATSSQIASIRHKGVLLVIALAAALSLLSAIGRLGLGAGLFEISRLIVSCLFVLALAAALWTERRVISRIVFRDPASPAARAWPWITLVYLAVALALFLALALGEVSIRGLAILAPIFCGAVAAVVYSLCMVILLRRRRALAPAAAPGPSADDPVPAAAAVDASGQQAAPRVAKNASAAAGAVAAAVWAGGMALAWGVPLWSEETNRIHGFWATLLILLLARLSWIAIRAFFDRRIAAEQPAAGPAESGDEGGANGSRLGTVLPLFRSFLLITVSVIAAMIVLSQIGVDVAPLFAGAGLIGVAIGFGSQSLVKDVFSGLFFLIDDAFRVGEYIETGGLKGTVERISVRSMQLRHQNGPLHTIPFGEITQLTNFSRDWVIMKLPIRVTFDTDPERVRKLIKKIGQELMADPVIGPKFVEPLKSQGVREIDDSGQIMRVKFMTRPGEQFVLRKMVYARIREAFAREGIEFAAREVRVRVTTQGAPLSEAETQEIAAGAAERALNP